MLARTMQWHVIVDTFVAKSDNPTDQVMSRSVFSQTFLLHRFRSAPDDGSNDDKSRMCG